MKIEIYTKSDTNGSSSFTMTPNNARAAKRIWKKLMYRWEHKKVLQIPGYKAAIASDEIKSIIFFKG